VHFAAAKIAIVSSDQTEHNRRQQAELYGEPLGDLLRRIGGALGLTQARLAETIGLSAPMLSQLISAQRIKIGNPAVVARLQALDQLAARVASDGLGPDELATAIDGIRGTSGVLTRSGPAPAAGGPVSSRGVVRGIQDLLRSVASADEILRAADRIAPDSPGLADVLRVYGAGRTDDAVAHFDRHTGI
jgi:transcriptional regulator with XRE-family HTH domain